MKKIFAIALALVMVFSMASAFAYCVTDIDWACATDVCNNGTPTIEVVPFVRSNTACAGESEFVQSNCAAAVVGERVYYAVKLTIPADLNEEWYEAATLSVDYSNLSAKEGGKEIADLAPVKLAGGDVTYAKVKDEAGVYWLKGSGVQAGWGTGWEKEGAAGVTFGNDNIFFGFALKSSAKVCVSIKSENKFTETVVNGYTVKMNPDTVNVLQISKDGKIVQVETDKDDKIVAFKVSVVPGTWYTVKTLNASGTKFYVDAATELDWTCNDAGKFLKEVMDAFKLNFGTCVTEKAIKANFGWKDEVKSCTEYKTNAMAVVDSDCVVSIPKTGDVSVVAYAVMAVVAAAGAMLKK